LEVLRFIEGIEDPREEWKIKHNLSSIIFTTLCSVLCGAQTWDDVTLFGRSKREWLENYISFENGIPSAWTFRRIFTLLKPECLEDLLKHHVNQIMHNKCGEHISIDGKSLRRSKREGIPCLKTITAWCHENALVLAEREVSEASNETATIPFLLESLDLKGTTVSIDAAGCQKTIAKTIKEKKGDYVLALKKNHEKLYNKMKEHTETLGYTKQYRLHDAFDSSHGRDVRRRYFGYDISSFPEANDWVGAKSVIAVENISFRKNHAVTASWLFYLSSHAHNNSKLPDYIRNHWGIENKLHWVLDVYLREDDDRKMERKSAKAFAALRRMSLNIIRSKDSQSKGSLRGKIKKAAWDTDYLLALLV
jgi:predicted transposase YbfD/YdcC